MTNKKVLLVDDEVEFTELLAERMRNRDMDVDTADSGEKAAELAQQKRYDAIIMDLAMPGMDGIETLKQLLQDNPDQQVVLLTGHATVPKSVEAIKHGAVEFLEKPADIDKLIEIVSRAKVKKSELTEKRMKESIEEIMKKRGW
ncbi:two-component system response regulator [candidate division LCP-89 bacterium B3_LCP]|uniref:Two-component system response regulator n=1 Tax=candidate division LCP-89 bacterium B3_LCP TaxID=2012998 RepID=A0A532UXX4_UNCL8|nr:MAG: two-component system response regulator [candidate division LCP-89 bacterium B3_LCP]